MRSWVFTLLEWSIALLVLGAMSLLAVPAHSQELDERASAEAALAGQRKELQAACGRPVRVTVDWASFETAFVDSYTPETAAAYCGEVVRAVSETCVSTPAVSAKVKGIACRFGKPALRAVSGGAIDATFDWEGLGLYEDSRAWASRYAATVGARATAPAARKNKPKG